ncbi:MAG: DNA repair protein RecN [Clostridia bacterium]|nr:DNA repair protein RecN [Clostridia bacterium]
MLQKLTIRNVALIERAELDFCRGFNVLSGETGAGKSVILDCIDFVLGAKAEKTMIRTGAEDCFVRAEFTVSESVTEALAELDIEAEDMLILTRTLSLAGKSTLKINGNTVTASMLKRVTSRLVDVHGQSEHFFLLKESNQLRLLDKIAGEALVPIKTELKKLLTERKEILVELQKIGTDEGERNRRLDILRFQIEEIQRAELKEGEEEELTAFRTRYANLEKLLSGLSAARELLLADGGGIDAINSARRSISSLNKYGEEYGKLAERLEAAAAEAEDIASTVETLIGETDVDEREAERVEARYDEIRSLKKKYGGNVKEILEFLARAEEERELLEDSDERFQVLQTRLNNVENSIYDTCVRLTDLRKSVAAGFTRRVTEELKTLNIASARFETEFGEYTRADAPKATSDGLGGVKFLFSANAGEPLKELGKIISGGEMSRFMLAVKAQLTDTDVIGTYIFDEIDAGIGGKTANVVAEKLCKIAKRAQVVCVSHLARIAAYADKEFLIEKHEESGKTFTEIKALDEEGRLREISRLIGSETGESARKYASELLQEAEIYKNSLNV